MARPLEVYVDSGEARRLLDEIREEEKAVRTDITALESELIRLLMEYSEVYYTYVAEWDRLCLLRDHAYLAINRGDWHEASSAARQAMATAPHDTESPLLLILGAIESGETGEPLQVTVAEVPGAGSTERPGSAGGVDQLLGSYLAEHPERSAPALVLRGNLLRARGDLGGALAAYEDAAKQYPAQAAALTDRLDPYQARSYLRKTQEGRYVIELYSAMMEGAGYFSPELQMARLAFDQGDLEQGRQQVIKHFARRRAQQQWGFILSDVRYCHAALGSYFSRMFPEMAFVELQLSKRWIGDELVVSVENRSTATLHNCTLLLCVNFTDMYEDDYEPFAVGKTRPVLPAGEEVEFGTVEVKLTLFGKDKGLDDIVHSRAILISNEAVLWVDTGEYRQEQAGSGGDGGEAPALSATQIDEALASCRVEVGSGFGKDDLTIRLPAQLAVLMPVFRLRVGEQELAPDKNYLEGDWIVLELPDAANLDDPEATGGDIVLVMNSRTVSRRLSLVPSGDGAFRLEPQSQGPSAAE